MPTVIGWSRSLTRPTVIVPEVPDRVTNEVPVTRTDLIRLFMVSVSAVTDARACCASPSASYDDAVSPAPVRVERTSVSAVISSSSRVPVLRRVRLAETFSGPIFEMEPSAAPRASCGGTSYGSRPGVGARSVSRTHRCWRPRKKSAERQSVPGSQCIGSTTVSWRSSPLSALRAASARIRWRIGRASPRGVGSAPPDAAGALTKTSRCPLAERYCVRSRSPAASPSPRRWAGR